MSECGEHYYLHARYHRYLSELQCWGIPFKQGISINSLYSTLAGALEREIQCTLDTYTALLILHHKHLYHSNNP